MTMQLDAVVDRAGPLWAELDGKPILLTGGTGFFGRWLLESLLQAQRRHRFNLRIAVLTRSIEAFRARAPGLAGSPFLQLIEGDIRSFAVPDGPFPFIIHGAATSAKAAFEGEDALERFETVLAGTRRVLDAAVAAGTERVLMLSSGSVYGGLSGAISENFPGAPLTTNVDLALAHGKRAAEFLGSYYAKRYGLSLSIARCFSFIGAYLPFGIHYAIGNFIQNALYESDITVRSDGTPVRSYLFAGDLVVWLLTMLLRGQPGAVYHVGSDHAVSLSELAHLVRDVLAPGKPVHILGEAGPDPRSFYVPEIGLAQRELGLDVWTPLDRAIRHTADAARQERWGDR